MLRFTAHDENGAQLVGLGLTAENIRRLQAGQPILVHLSELVPGLPVPIDVLIWTGENETTMAESIASLIDETTERRGTVL